jgi:hypothetical protein
MDSSRIGGQGPMYYTGLSILCKQQSTKEEVEVEVVVVVVVV